METHNQRWNEPHGRILIHHNISRENCFDFWGTWKKGKPQNKHVERINECPQPKTRWVPPSCQMSFLWINTLWRAHICPRRTSKNHRTLPESLCKRYNSYTDPSNTERLEISLRLFKAHRQDYIASVRVKLTGQLASASLLLLCIRGIMKTEISSPDPGLSPAILQPRSFRTPLAFITRSWAVMVYLNNNKSCLLHSHFITGD